MIKRKRLIFKENHWDVEEYGRWEEANTPEVISMSTCSHGLR